MNRRGFLVLAVVFVLGSGGRCLAGEKKREIRLSPVAEKGVERSYSFTLNAGGTSSKEKAMRKLPKHGPKICKELLDLVLKGGETKAGADVVVAITYEQTVSKVQTLSGKMGILVTDGKTGGTLYEGISKCVFQAWGGPGMGQGASLRSYKSYYNPMSLCFEKQAGQMVRALGATQ